MSEQEFERYLKMLGGFLGLDRRQREAIAIELRDHFDERLEELLATGVSRSDAITATLEEFGDASGLTQQFVNLARNRRRKRIVRFTMFSASSIAAAILLLFAMWPENARVPLTRTTVAQAEAPVANANSEADENELPEADRKILAQLETKVYLEFVDTPLNEVIAFLLETQKVDIDLNRLSLENAGISLVAPVTLELKQVRLRAALNQLFGNLGLEWGVKDGSLVVSHESDAKPLLVNRIYNVRDVLAMLGDDNESETNLTLLLELVSTFTGNPIPGWTEQGGDSGTLRGAVQELIVVNQTPKVHEQIRAFLAALRRLSTIREKPTEKALAPILISQQSESETEILKKLGSPCKPFEFVDTPLADVIEYLSRQQEVPIKLDQRRAEAAGLSRDTPVTFKLRGETTFRLAFNRVLRDLRLAIALRDDVIMLVPQDDNNELQTRIYPVWDLVGKDPDKLPSAMVRLAELIQSTTGTIDPIWVENGGLGCLRQISELQILIVQTSLDVHDQIESLFAGIRQSRNKSSAKANPPKPVVESNPDQPVLRTYYIPPIDLEGTLAAKPEELSTSIQMVLLAEKSTEQGQVQITIVRNRLLIMAKPVVHQRLEKMMNNELRGMFLRFERYSPANADLLGPLPNGTGGGGLGGGGGGLF